jgi:hypothetical protein
MRQLTGRLLFALSISACLANPAWADLAHPTIYVNTLPKNIYNGTYVGAAGATWDPTHTKDFDIVCIDYDHTTYVPGSFEVTITNLAEAGSPGSPTRFGGPGTQAKYNEAAWLYSQIATHPLEVGQIQYAMWELLSPAATPNYYGDWLNRAASANLTGFNTSAYWVLTPYLNSNQEFIALNLPNTGPLVDPPKVPEPSGLATLLLGLLAALLLLPLRSR